MPRIRMLLTNRKFMAIAFIFIGVVVMAVYGLKSYRSYQQWQYIREQGVDRGVASIEAIRPWMTMRYVSVAYAVPQEYIFSELNISYNRRNSNETLGHLSRVYEERPKTDKSRDPILVAKVGKIILAYRGNPVATGLKDIRPWMTLQYIGNSTGVQVDYLFTRLDIDPGNSNEFKQLDHLAREVHFSDGTHGLIDAIKEILSADEGSQ